MNLLFANDSAPRFGFRLLQEMPYLRVFYDERNHWLHANWRGTQTCETVQAGVAALLHWIEVEQCNKLLNDNIFVTHLDLSAEQWKQLHMHLVELHTKGLHYLAWVYAPVASARRSTDIAVSNIRFPITLTFETMEVATEWLLHV